MGKTPWQCFFKICVPMALPGIAAGLALALMETINDFGVADFFGLQTLTIGVFQYISTINDLPSAFSLSLIILIIMILLYVFEQKMRGGRKFNNSSYESIHWSRYQLNRSKTILVFILSFLPIFFGFFIPLIFNFFIFITNFQIIDYSNFLSSLYNSIILGGFVGFFCVLVSIFINFYSRFSRSKKFLYYKKIINMGYALPGKIIEL